MANDAGEAARIPKLAKEREDAKALLAKRKKVRANQPTLSQMPGLLDGRPQRSLGRRLSRGLVDSISFTGGSKYEGLP
jgi:hypothetical protein